MTRRPVLRARPGRRRQEITGAIACTRITTTSGRLHVRCLAVRHAARVRDLVGGVMSKSLSWLLVGLFGTVALPAMAQSFRVQCPTSTVTHPAALHDNNSEPAYTAPTTLVSTNPGTPANGYLVPSA